MAKQKTVYACTECGYETPRWNGRCPSCGQFNTIEEAAREPAVTSARRGVSGASAKPQGGSGGRHGAVRCIDAVSGEDKRLNTNINELDRVLGGGLVRGSLTLLGGEPGIGKSTLLLQICRTFDYGERPILYVSGEESAAQIKMRAERIGITDENLYLLAETDMAEILNAIDALTPEIVVIDSIQTMYIGDLTSSAGSVTQIRETAAMLMGVAKGRGIPVLIIGHVTKEGSLAGPRVLEHMVDTVLYFEGERTANYRVVRAAKNRFGATNEVGVFEMAEEGLRGVDNPSAYMLAGRPVGEPGSVVTCALEGTRAILAEVQALVTPTNFGQPRRVVNGLDYNRAVMLVAALEKKAGLKLGQYDVYVNIAGGMRITEPALDLAAAAAIAGSYRNTAVGAGVCVFGEMGLAGEARAVTHAERRVLEAAKLGFETCVVPQANLRGLKGKGDIRLLGVSNVHELIGACIV